MRPLSRLPVALAFVALAAAGCASPGRAVPLFGEPEEKQLIRIQVQNNDFNDATLHALWDGGRKRLGTVTGKGSGTFTLAWDHDGPLQLEIDFLAGGKCTTGAITAKPGDSLDLLIGIAGSSDCSATD